ncbi:hypothetical protein AB0K11_13480 [Mycobacterium sp. NPDC050551]|uniref:DUF7159 family protein n=1 Tax=Mycobacterium sp. NPDC050551 TaxID=3155407 RepID=UPI003440BFA3
MLVEGATGEGATIDKGTLELGGADDGLNDLVDAVLGEGPFAAVPGRRPRAIGVTWLGSATAAASTVLELLADKGADNVIAVSESDAAAALATGIGDIAGLDDVAVCVVEPDAAVAAVVDAHEVVVDVVERFGAGDAADLAHWLTALVDGCASEPADVYVLGSAGDLDDVVVALGATGLAVISAAEADLALARGAALASARSTYDLDLGFAAAPAPAGTRRFVTPRVAAVGGVLVAAVVTFVVSLSVALTPSSTPEHEQTASESEQTAKAALVQEPVEQLPSRPQKLPPRPAPAAPPVDIDPPAAAPAPPEVLPVEPVEAAPAPEAPAWEPPAADPAPQGLPEPGVPAYVPPAPPAYVPPAAPSVPAVEGTPPGFTPGNPAYVPPRPDGTVPPVQQPQPRLRDRIIGRLPLINRLQGPGG